MTLKTVRAVLSACDDYYVWSSLLSHVLGVSRQELIVSSDRFIPFPLLQHFEELYSLYSLKHKPLAYLLGYENFAWKSFSVNEFTLIPRPETEYILWLVQSFLEKNLSITNATLVDVGTWSWCLGISLLDLLDGSFSACYLVDISPHALAIARWNAMRLLSSVQQAKVRCVESDLLSFSLTSSWSLLFEHLIIVANLPYIPEWSSGVEPSVMDWEPALALFSGEDWLSHYRRLLSQISILKETSRAFCGGALFMEMMKDQYFTLVLEYPSLWQWYLHHTFHDNIVIAAVVLA